MMDEQRVEVYFDSLRPDYPEYLNALEKEALRTEVPIIRRATRDVLRYLLKTKKPARVLEVGTAIGYSALFMRHCLPETSKITTIEKVEMRLVEARKNLERYDKTGQIELIEGDAVDVLQQLCEDRKTYDFIFMDAAKGQYLNFLPDVITLLEPGGVLISDNVLHDRDVLESRFAVTRRDRTIHARMREYLYTLMHHDKLETICLAEGDGMTISTRMEDDENEK